MSCKQKKFGKKLCNVIYLLQKFKDVFVAHTEPFLVVVLEQSLGFFEFTVGELFLFKMKSSFFFLFPLS